MANHDFNTGIDFARAVAQHFKLPEGTHADMELVTGVDDAFAVKLKITLAADDLAAIAGHMPGRTLPVPALGAAQTCTITTLAGVEHTMRTHAPSPASVDPIPSLAKVTLAPGDALVLTTPNVISLEQGALVKQRIRAELGADVRILIVDRGTSVAVLGGIAAAGDGVTGD